MNILPDGILLFMARSEQPKRVRFTFTLDSEIVRQAREQAGYIPLSRYIEQAVVEALLDPEFPRRIKRKERRVSEDPTV